MPLQSPFESSIAKPGHGEVVLSLLPPAQPTLKTLTYKYPLKLLTRSPAFVPETSALERVSRPVHLYLLSYGGGLLPGDVIDVSIKLDPGTRLVVTTPQGSTKIFKTDRGGGGGGGMKEGSSTTCSDKSKQLLDVKIEGDAALCYLPDPSVPFRDSRYEQLQTFFVGRGQGQRQQASKGKSSLCVLDWVTEGRTARGENWDFHLWRGKNEVWTTDDLGKKKLLLRDSLILNDECEDEGLIGADNDNDNDYNRRPNSLIRERTSPHGVVGTLILYGPIFENLSSFIMDRFTSQPRIGARNWSSSVVLPPANSGSGSTPKPGDGVTWTAARVRAGFVLVKFGAKGFEPAKEWLGGLFREEGSIVREFGEETLLSL